MSAEDRDRLKRVTELAQQQADGQQLHSNSDRGKPLALHHKQPQTQPQTHPQTHPQTQPQTLPQTLPQTQPQTQPQTSSKFSLEREFQYMMSLLVATWCCKT